MTPAESSRADAKAICDQVSGSQDEARAEAARLRGNGLVVWEYQNPMCDPYADPTLQAVAEVRDPATQYLIGAVRFRAHEPGS